MNYVHVGKIVDFGHKKGKGFGERAVHPQSIFLGVLPDCFPTYTAMNWPPIPFLVVNTLYHVITLSRIETEAYLAISVLIITITISSNVIDWFLNWCIKLINLQSCNRTVGCNRTVTQANHFKSSPLNPPITKFITVSKVIQETDRIGLHSVLLPLLTTLGHYLLRA